MIQDKTKSLITELENKLFDLDHLSDSSFPYSISAAGGENYYPIEKIRSNDEEVFEVPLLDFFRKLIKDHSWMTKEERKRSWKYNDLKEFMSNNFKEVKIVKMGSVFIDVHIIGKTHEDDIIIISTMELSISVYQKVDC